MIQLPDFNVQEVDFAVTTLTPTADRKTVVDFTTVFGEDGTGILIKKPKGSGEPGFFKIFKPLHYEYANFLSVFLCARAELTELLI